MKRKRKEVLYAILKALSDGKEHSYGDIERKANTNWRTVRDHCEDLELFDAVTVSKDNRIQINERGTKIFIKLKS